MKKLFLLLGITTTLALVAQSTWDTELRWDWEEIDLSDETFWQNLQQELPHDFTFGVATSAFQIEGTQTSTGHVQNSFTRLNPHYENDSGPQHWERYQEDIKLLAQTGVDSYRLSIAWDKIEPQEGQFDQNAMDHYIDECKRLKEQGIDPVVCLFHFTLPPWFDDKGGFEKSENNGDFVRFSQYVQDNLKEYVSEWMTFNEPNAYALSGYLIGALPPYAIHPLRAGVVLRNVLTAHIEVYNALKEKQPESSIGFCMVFNPLDSYNNNALERWLCNFGSTLAHDVILDFFKTGQFNWLYLVTGTRPQAPQSLDWLGVNYYTHDYFNYFSRPKCRPDESCAPDNGKAIYAEGLYRSIEKASLALPDIDLYVTENGIADRTDKHRNDFLKKHLYAMNEARKAGHKVKRYGIWAFIDTLGWKKLKNPTEEQKYTSCYGLFKLDLDTKDRSLRPEAQPFVDFLNARKHQK